MGSRDNLEGLLRQLAVASSSIDNIVLSSKFIRKTVLELDGDLQPNGFDISNAESYLEDEDPLQFWTQWFDHLFDEWHCDRLLFGTFNTTVERLSSSARQFDRLVPRLINVYRGLPNFPARRVQMILDRHSAINGFLNSADILMESWRARDGQGTSETVLRARRPMPTVIDDDDDESLVGDSRVVRTAEKEASVEIDTSQDSKGIMSTSTLITLTTFTTLIASGIQFLAFDRTLKLNKGAATTPGRTTDPDFYSALQNMLMQFLSLYTVLIPAMKAKTRARGAYVWWTWTLAAGSLICTTMAVGIYVISTPLTPLLAFWGSAMQAIILLQLVIGIDRGLPGETRKKNV